MLYRPYIFKTGPSGWSYMTPIVFCTDSPIFRNFCTDSTISRNRFLFGEGGDPHSLLFKKTNDGVAVKILLAFNMIFHLLF